MNDQSRETLRGSTRPEKIDEIKTCQGNHKNYQKALIESNPGKLTDEQKVYQTDLVMS